MAACYCYLHVNPSNRDNPAFTEKVEISGKADLNI